MPQNAARPAPPAMPRLTLFRKIFLALAVLLLALLLIFAGVIGGLLGFGLVGIFVGPVLLAVSYTLAMAWLDNAEPPATEAGP